MSRRHLDLHRRGATDRAVRDRRHSIGRLRRRRRGFRQLHPAGRRAVVLRRTGPIGGERERRHQRRRWSQTWLASTSTVPAADQFTWSVTPPGGPSPIPVGRTQTTVGAAAGTRCVAHRRSPHRPRPHRPRPRHPFHVHLHLHRTHPMTGLTNKEHLMTVHLHRNPRRPYERDATAATVSSASSHASSPWCAMIGGASTALAADLTVQQGETIRFYSGDCHQCHARTRRRRDRHRHPGTSRCSRSSRRHRIHGVSVVQRRRDREIRQCATRQRHRSTTIQVEGTSANASGSFVPVAAPGPCIVITANRIVPFGDVTVGGGYKDTAGAAQRVRMRAAIR